MDPDVELAVSSLLDNGGKLDEAVGLLSESYAGHAQVSSFIQSEPEVMFKHNPYIFVCFRCAG